jgi:redox-sensitive bicupin YhaK (pirin superfamily)
MPGRTVKQQHPALRDDIGDLTTRRPLPGPGLSQIDPFLFLNHHGPQTYAPNNGGLPFGPHPHRGFETVTFILEGDLAHHDTGGHESIIHAGGVQWMTAGSGLVHAEVSPAAFKKSGGDLEILQLWVNLPSRLKMTKPRYKGVQREEIPVVTLDEGRVKLDLISGELGATTGAITSLTGVFMSTIALAAGGQVALAAPRYRSVFLYVVRGKVSIGGKLVQPWHLVSLNADADTVEITAEAESFVVFGHADPIGEPVVSHGPFVMNTREEIVQTINDYQSGKFGGEPLNV